MSILLDKKQRCGASATPTLVREEAGIQMGIAPNLEQAASHAAQVLQSHYQFWKEKGRHTDWGQYKRRYFTVVVGGGNTIKAQYAALLKHHSKTIDWVGDVRFFFLDHSTGELDYESADQGLSLNFIAPLARKLSRAGGGRKLAGHLGLSWPASEDAIVQAMQLRMTLPIQLASTRQALDSGSQVRAMRLAKAEASRYQRELQQRLGDTLQVHYVASGVGKKGSLGAFKPYSPELAVTEPGVMVVKQANGALRIALNRGVLTGAETISLLVSGSLKLKALGRFEMEETTDFERTVMETPLRMLRASPKIAAKVTIFADEQALHFEESVYQITEGEKVIPNKAETREGEEANGIHAILLHGFMGLFSFTSFLIRLPSAWTVSALHRGSHAKTLPSNEIFPFYARALRQVMLQNWSQGRPVPVAGHSIAGVISDHLLLSLTGDSADADIPDYNTLSLENRQLIDALRAGGLIHLASWAPVDGPHTGTNIQNLKDGHSKGTPRDYSGISPVYQRNERGELVVSDAAAVSSDNRLSRLDSFLNTRIAPALVGSINLLTRRLLDNPAVQQRMLNADMPYVMRIVGGRLLKTASFYGLCKEVNAAMHDTVEYQRRHLKALDILIAYDIPYLSMIHEDDFLVSAQRHREEHEYLLAARLAKEGVRREQDLQVPVHYQTIKRQQTELPVDPLNPHLLIMSTSAEGNSMARQITAAMTDFVNRNAAGAIARGDIGPLESVTRWQESQPRSHRSKKRSG